MSNKLLDLTFIQQPLAKGWEDLVANFFVSPAGIKLKQFLQQQFAQRKTIYPKTPLKVYQLVALNQVRVVILGQDPYHGEGQAQGLAFSVPDNLALPPSLRNIFYELKQNLAIDYELSGDLTSWSKAGIFLLNTVLTVEADLPNSHANQGWETLTDATIKELNQATQPILFVLWGKYAQTKSKLITSQQHKILIANHPSPLSARKAPIPFIGCQHFGRIENWLNNYQISLTDVLQRKPSKNKTLMQQPSLFENLK